MKQSLHTNVIQKWTKMFIESILNLPGMFWKMDKLEIFITQVTKEK